MSSLRRNFLLTVIGTSRNATHCCRAHCVTATKELKPAHKKLPAHIENYNFSKFRFIFLFGCSPWDMGRFFSTQCQLCSIPVPKFARKWINLRKLYRNFYKVPKGTLQDMVNNLGMRFEGRPHSGMDDARNIARILQKMVQDGCEIKFNECLHNNT